MLELLCIYVSFNLLEIHVFFNFLYLQYVLIFRLNKNLGQVFFPSNSGLYAEDPVFNIGLKMLFFNQESEISFYLEGKNSAHLESKSTYIVFYLNQNLYF